MLVYAFDIYVDISFGRGAAPAAVTTAPGPARYWHVFCIGNKGKMKNGGAGRMDE